MKSPSSIALFGAAGEMGRYLLSPFLSEFSELIMIDREHVPAEKEKALGAQLLVMAVPRDALGDCLAPGALSSEQLVVEICSAKEGVAEVIEASGAAHLSLHPMNGPHTEWAKQKWLLVGEVPDHPAAPWFLEKLAKPGVALHPVQSAEEHDRLMAYVLGLPEFFTVLFSEFFDRMPELGSQAEKFKQLSAVGSPAYASLVKMWIHTISSTPLWLREELFSKLGTSLSDLTAAVMADFSRDDHQKVTLASMRQQAEQLESCAISGPAAARIPSLVETDFDMINLAAFGSEKRRGRLGVQKPCERSALLRSDRPFRIGIHGIRGSFTDEAWFRFTHEFLSIEESAYEVVELTHSANVLRAVEKQEVDFGIVAFANSGSGGYIASIEAMGRHQFELLAMFTMPIHMCILSHESISSIGEVTEFFGHPVAISQCRKTLVNRWPDIPIRLGTDEMDTALSAKLLSEGELESTLGVFASRRAADFYGLSLLEQGVHHDPNNTTAFAVFRSV